MCDGGRRKIKRRYRRVIRAVKKNDAVIGYFRSDGTSSGCGRTFSILEIRVEVEDSSPDNHLKGDDPKKEVRHDFDFPFHHWIVPPFSTAPQCSLRLALGQHQLHLGDLQIQQKQSQDGF
ncbi:hypothetical protein AB1E18_004723 [Capra hircus]